ncbi:MAG: beta-lactamase family protein [Microbacterium sp.]|jgi:methyl acetate hydrolase|nr:beta-lactamase family protein [Microbacterium sp.]
MRAEAVDRAVQDAVDEGIPGIIAGVTGIDGVQHLTARGRRLVDAPDPVTADGIIALYSATKQVTATAALQCVEDGLFELDTPAVRLVPEIERVGVLESIDEDGTARTRPPRTPITVRDLLLHTSGFGYDMFDERLALLARTRPRTTTPLRDSLFQPLLHDPGKQWTYGISMDWLGLVIAAAREQRLEEVFRTRIFDPCAMTDTSFDMHPERVARLVPAHRRRSDGTLRPSPALPPARPEVDMGGQGLFGTVADYLAFLRVWLGDGTAPGGRVLRPETVSWAVQAMPGVTVHPFTSAIPALTRPVDLFPGRAKSWAVSLLRLEEDLPGRRRAGSLSWAGLANVHFWIDRSSGIAAVWSAQLLPWFDDAAERGLDAFEHAVYS